MKTNTTSIHALRDGSTIRCRPLRASDRSKLLDGFEHLSPDSRYRRFFSPTPRLTPSMLKRLFDLDGHDRFAVGAERLRMGWLGGAGLGVARFIRLPDSRNTAEIAVSIVDEVQGQGLGTILMYELAAAARDHGITRFVAWVQPDNEPMKALIAKLDPLAHAHHEDGLLFFDFAVPGAIALPSAKVPVRRTGPLDGFVGWCADGLRQLLPSLPGGAFGRT
ncbi:GNAT family N-acetyltransferase [Candidatus Binatia bacterium]|nr:GNAT family N-acetyltransferase [Candidatus Binatia bacterium]